MRASLVAIPSVVVVALTAAARAQTVFVNGGGGALASAVAAATSGTTLVVAAGYYTGFTVADKDLTIVAPNRATVEGGITATSGVVMRTLRLVDLDIGPGPGGPPYGYSAGTIHAEGHLHARGCTAEALTVGTTSALARRVWLEGCTITPSYRGSMLFADVAAADCSFQGGLAYQSFPGWTCNQGLGVFGSLRAERCTFLAATGAADPKPGLSVFGSATLAGCTLAGSTTTTVAYSGLGSLAIDGGTTLPGGSFPLPTVRAFATLQWTQRAWYPGGVSTFVVREAPDTMAVTVLTTSLQPWTTSIAAEVAWFGASGDWGVWSYGLSDANGDYADFLPVPNTPTLLDAEVWLVGAFVDPFPLRTSVPLGGALR